MIGIAIPVLLFLPSGPEFFGQGLNIWVSAFLFVLGALTDFWDGWIARRQKIETPLGKILDPTADKIFILCTMASFAAKGVYSYWYLVPIFIREIAVTFCRIAWLKEGHVIAAERAGKLKLTLQVISVIISFLYLISPTAGLSILNHAFLCLALVMTIYSGLLFFMNNTALLKTREFSRSVATMMGIGCLKPFPGTYGSFVGLVLVLLTAYDLLLHVIVFLILVWVAYALIPQIGLRKDEDPLEIVIDEVCGILLAFFFIPITFPNILLGFFLFRAFDTLKVFPLNWLEKKEGVHGIMLDDLGAGVYTWLFLKIFGSH